MNHFIKKDQYICGGCQRKITVIHSDDLLKRSLNCPECKAVITPKMFKQYIMEKPIISTAELMIAEQIAAEEQFQVKVRKGKNI